MIDALKSWYRGLSPREQRLVGLAGILAALVILVFGIIMPALSAIDEARTAHDEAVERRGRIEALAARATSTKSSNAIAAEADIDLVVTQSAAESGFDLLKSDGTAPGQISFRIDQARAPALLGWLSSLEGQGLQTDSLTLRGNSAGTITVDARLRRTR
ncbi:MAG: type II secretion system protein M [Sphingomonadaceae bacterium]|nr:type II secretion system protein M [Sphingomonadaceae bacterium]